MDNFHDRSRFKWPEVSKIANTTQRVVNIDPRYQSIDNMEQLMQSHGCTFQGGCLGKSSHVTFVLVDGPSAHAVDDVLVDLGLAVWNTSTMYPVITIEEDVAGMRAMQ